MTSLANKKIIFQGAEGRVRGIEETLTDGSKVYNIEIGNENNFFEYACITYNDCVNRYGQIIRSIQN